MVVRADSGFYAEKVVAACRAQGARFSISVRLHKSLQERIASIPEEEWKPSPTSGASSGAARRVSTWWLARWPLYSCRARTTAHSTSCRTTSRTSSGSPSRGGHTAHTAASSPLRPGRTWLPQAPARSASSSPAPGPRARPSRTPTTRRRGGARHGQHHVPAHPRRVRRTRPHRDMLPEDARGADEAIAQVEALGIIRRRSAPPGHKGPWVGRQSRPGPGRQCPDAVVEHRGARRRLIRASLPPQVLWAASRRSMGEFGSHGRAASAPERGTAASRGGRRRRGRPRCRR